MEVTCLIPCYNEQDRIAHVLQVVTQVRGIQQVICIDDGSSDNTATMISRQWPMVQVIRLSQNRGKAAAIQYGLQFVQHELVLLMDADLQELNGVELEKAVSAFGQTAQVDMLILRRIRSPWFVRWYRSDILLSGERLLLRHDLEQVLVQPVARYQLEVAINRYMIKHHKLVRWVPWSAMNTYKVDKLGVLEGSRRELKMYIEIVDYVGFVHMLVQLGSFTRRLKKQKNATREWPRFFAGIKL
ncbi:glycosyltransferase family 2 protein [Pontibacter ramchanderi]|uniref:Glycosyltransferase involved in cell wall biosynthesis n=1 Tax=Pontibacter ramchanderi TaxID=1179743 RepID=A0A2N3U702_9BACT|nr:glycosyltransferase [Pontibacter ramchanderi]PKV62518.1 glycosyltransferase involved in cell wall biosynthesis [Pontibacter ramchanderi]